MFCVYYLLISYSSLQLYVPSSFHLNPKSFFMVILKLLFNAIFSISYFSFSHESIFSVK